MGPSDSSPRWTERGRGRPVVFLHGYPLTHEIFSPQLESISRAYHVVLLDFPGYGLAQGQPIPRSLTGFADFVHDLLAERFPGPVSLVGHSFGGYVALELARKHPEQLASLVLADTRARADTPVAREKRLATAKRLEEPREHLDPGEVVRGLLARSTWSNDRALVERLTEMVAGVASRTIIATLRAIADRPDLTPILSTVHVPTLVIWGEEDQLIPPAESQEIVAHVVGCRGVGIPSAGHLPSLESPAAFSGAILAHLEQLGPASEASQP